MGISRVVYVVESPLTSRDHNRFGVDVLTNAGFDVEIWEVQDLFLPRDQGPAAVSMAGCQIRSFTSFGDLVASCRALREDTVVILICAVYVSDLPRYLPLIRALMQGKSRLATVTAVERPPIPLQPTATSGGLARAHQLLRRLRAKDLSIRSASSILMSRLRARIFEGLVRCHLGGFRELSWIWAGTNIDSVNPLFVGSLTRIRYIHTLDFDRILENQLEPTSVSPGIVYLDAMGPLHPDFAVLGMRVEIGPRAWFKLVNGVLDDLAAASGLEVTVAAHPRADPGSLDAMYAGKRVVHGQTASLIRAAKSVVITDPTTSIGMAAWYRRPITVVKCGTLFETHQIELEQYADLLNLEVLEPGSVPVNWSPANVDLLAYTRFIQAYVKQPGTLTLPFWEVAANDLLSSSASEPE